MSLPSFPARRRNVRPVVDGLESRELLSAAPMVAAQLSMISGQEMSQSIVGQLPNGTHEVVLDRSRQRRSESVWRRVRPSDFQPGGCLHPGDVLVSNFNNNNNLQGTGTTIVKVSPPRTSNPSSSQFNGPGRGRPHDGLGVLKEGFVIVGSVPSTDGTPDTVKRARSRSSTGKASWWPTSPVPVSWTDPGTSPSTTRAPVPRSSSPTSSAGR